jgi:hypothetical protein
MVARTEVFRPAGLPGLRLTQRQIQRHAANLIFAPGRPASQASGANSRQHVGIANDFDHHQRGIGQHHREARAFDELVQILHIRPGQRHQRSLSFIQRWRVSRPRSTILARVEAGRSAALPRAQYRRRDRKLVALAGGDKGFPGAQHQFR